MWLAQLLKRHCAPMRDSMVDHMVDRLRAGIPPDVPKGLLELFGVLESMKLGSQDVANHQIRHLYCLIVDTISFEQACGNMGNVLFWSFFVTGTLLHEHHDFFLASQYPMATRALPKLWQNVCDAGEDVETWNTFTFWSFFAAGAWKHDIHSFLELPRCQTRFRTFVNAVH
ncbi:hypothetical protein EJ06DRAFT_576691 [Trichodelitschia bisporula]|uniref:Uncharacterized protein n=1 Tax=Trichodelitschia bisporula TaxID=703511 RepID=A0A6G1HX26_9PEZI|nr:hypothetical protein EJ06DRAFT_576691 [Trichodelitschia bisporula]